MANKTGKPVPADERLKRAQGYIDAAKAMSEPTDAREHGAWIVKRRSCVRHADEELRAARRMGADDGTVRRMDAQVEAVWKATKLKGAK